MICRILDSYGPPPKTCPELHEYIAMVTALLPQIDQIKAFSADHGPSWPELRALWSPCNPPTISIVTWYDTSIITYTQWISIDGGTTWQQISSGQAAYYVRVLATETADLIGFWRLNENGGAGTAVDSTAFGHNGVPTGVTFAGDTAPDGNNAATFDGATSRIAPYSASLAAVFGSTTGTLMCQAKVSGVGVWTDGANRTLAAFGVNASNRVEITKSSANNTLFVRYRAGGGIATATVTPFNPTTYFNPCITWDKPNDRMRFFVDGVQQGADVNALGVWAGAIVNTNTAIGALSTTPSQLWSGSLALVPLWRIALTPTQVASLAS